MHISLTKSSDVPIRHQLAEQIVFLITTGQLRPGEELPSVRTLARLLKIHHNTVSEAYKDLVDREWLTRKPGSRLTVGANSASHSKKQPTLDELINESIQRAREMGYSLQALRARVRERLMAEPPDHILVVEPEEGLREIICQELQECLHWPIRSCSWDTFVREPGLAIGAQVVVPNHDIAKVKQLISPKHPPVALVYSQAVEHMKSISDIVDPSIIAVASVSQSLLRTARSMLAASVCSKHIFQEFRISGKNRLNLKGIDLVFCDTVALPLVVCRNKVRYRLLDPSCLDNVRIALTADTSDLAHEQGNKPH